ncbi:peptide/nickel transport system permease protein [Paenibacillus taihuensis]|uniref:Peptide/nickel transport system permease protein n=1 Tax=Paenibacillus taihuensis TaxID=1156355 RepID=A0A3D9Q386_9BACL|nr:ABC transporter permease subunit [Paenibacillus taihuensis]REE55374.1 peptide/nickel transport system permease protein [Paenibacillus taihuensis]
MNKTLITGLIIIVIMIAASLFGQYFAPHTLDEHQSVTYVVDENGEGDLTVPPIPPGKQYPLGTDKEGYDMLAKLLAGSKYTIFISLAIAFLRLLLGGIIGLFLGYFSKIKPSRTDKLPIWNMLNGIPIFIIVWMIMIGITMNPAASPLYMSSILAVILTLVGIPTVASTMKEKTMIMREKQFILSAKSIGAGHWTIIRRHIFPHLKESFVILFVQEIVLSLSLFGQLAIFNIFVGGTTMYFDPVQYVSRSNEWSGLIGQARDYLFIYQWVLFIPLIAYIIYILGFHLISVGLEKKYKQQFSKFSHI